MQILLLVLFTILLEISFVVLTIAVAERRRLLSAITSGIIEPLKFLSIILLVESDQKLVIIIVLSFVVAISNYFTIFVFDWWDRRKLLKNKAS